MHLNIDKDGGQCRGNQQQFFPPKRNMNHKDLSLVLSASYQKHFDLPFLRWLPYTSAFCSQTDFEFPLVDVMNKSVTASAANDEYLKWLGELCYAKLM